MRVGVVGPVGLDRSAENVGDALREMGHRVTQLGPAGPSPRHRYTARLDSMARSAFHAYDERAQRSIANAALDAECEVVISLDARLLPGAVSRMRKGGVRVAFWFPDHVGNMGRQLMFLAPYHALFFKEPHLVDRLRANLDLPVYYLPQACNPRWHRPQVPAATEPYIVTASSQYPSRVRLLERLIEKGIPLRLYGGEFPRWLGQSIARESHSGRYLVREDKARVFRSAAGVLNTMHPAEVHGVNLRLFEATGSGGAVLTEYRSSVPDLFDVGQEVMIYRDFDELVHQASELLADASRARQLGDAAAARAHRDHTYERRLSRILETVA